MSIATILLLLAFVFFVLACIPGVGGRLSWVALGLAAWVLASLLGAGFLSHG